MYMCVCVIESLKNMNFLTELLKLSVSLKFSGEKRKLRKGIQI